MITVQDLAFEENHLQPQVSPAERALRQAESSPLLVKYAAVLLALLLLIAFCIRPALRAVTSPAAKTARGAAPQLAASAAKQPLPAPEPPAPDSERVRAQEILDQVSGVVKREPAQSSRLLQSWIHSE
jgi:flagellar M-ring protein FliF